MYDTCCDDESGVSLIKHFQEQSGSKVWHALGSHQYAMRHVAEALLGKALEDCVLLNNDYKPGQGGLLCRPALKRT